MTQDDLVGRTNEHSDYHTTDRINEFKQQGYLYVSSTYPDDGLTFDNKDKQDQVFEVHLKEDQPSKEGSKTPEKPIDSRTVDNHVSAKSTAKRELPQTSATINTGIWTGLVSMIASLGLLGASKKRKKN